MISGSETPVADARSDVEFAPVRSPYVRIEQLTTQEQVTALSYVAGALHSFLARKGGTVSEAEAVETVARQLHLTTEEVRAGVQFGKQDGKFLHDSQNLSLS